MHALVVALVVGAPMPPFQVERWVNSPPLTPEKLRGKVVLVDFWEYTCVNCIRTLPFVKAWNEKYGPSGLVVIGVHAPEFDFGKRAENIDRGIKDHGLTYPIALDNDFKTWLAYDNHAWPAKYLFDRDGKLAGVWLGEGEYDKVEDKMRALLGGKLPPPTDQVKRWLDGEGLAAGQMSPETYLGTERREKDDGVARVGAWESKPEYIEHKGDEFAKVVLDFVGSEVNLVMQPPPKGPGEVIIKLDGKQVGVARVDHAGMYRLVQGASHGKHRLELETKDEGLRMFAFTFGP